MTSVDRAKRFLQNKARTLALTAAPLAALVSVAPPAKAGPVLSFTSISCSGSGTNLIGPPTGSCSGSLMPPASNGVNGVTLNGDMIGTISVSGSAFSTQIGWFGSTNGGAFTGWFPLAWNFNILSSSGGAVNWTLIFNFNGPGGAVVMESGSGAVATGTDRATLSGVVTSWDVTLTGSVPCNVCSDTTVEVSVPAGGSVDVNVVPEPSMLALFSPVLGFLLLRRRRKKP